MTTQRLSADGDALCQRVPVTVVANDSDGAHGIAVDLQASGTSSTNRRSTPAVAFLGSQPPRFQPIRIDVRIPSEAIRGTVRYVDQGVRCESTASAERVFGILADTAAWPEWNAGVVRVDMGGPFAEGTEAVMVLPDLARLADDVIGDLRRSGEPLLAEVFAVIDRRHTEPLSLRDVARELGMTPGHLTTIVRHRTGCTVQEWIIERRMAEARSLLADTDLPVAEVARRVGISDPGYFSRLFRRLHGTSPRTWLGRPEPYRALLQPFSACDNAAVLPSCHTSKCWGSSPCSGPPRARCSACRCSARAT
jgi:AraC-like DNA-binding protein